MEPATIRTPQASPEADGEMRFAPDYATARSGFLRAVRETRGRHESLNLGLKGPSGEDLAIDIAWYGSDRPRRVLLHSSGLHGVEGFAGSAIQRRFLSSPPDVPGGCALAIVHVLNPWGMAWRRRVNERNVDLNRNWRTAGDGYAGAADAYHRLDPFFNPASPPSRDFFALRAAWRVLREGLPALKQAVAGGQYEYPRGIFFGGKELESGPRLYRDWMSRRLSSAEHICAIDVHTGLGRFGEDLLLVERRGFDRLKADYGARVTALHPDKGAAFVTRGGLDSFLPTLFPGRRVDFLCQEFGTYGPIRVVHALREENRWHHYGTGGADHPAKRALMEAFCPRKRSWRSSVLLRGLDLLRRASSLTFGSADRRRSGACLQDCGPH